MSHIVVYFTALVSRCSVPFIPCSFGRTEKTISMRSRSVILFSARQTARMSFTISTLPSSSSLYIRLRRAERATASAFVGLRPNCRVKSSMLSVSRDTSW